METTDDRDEIPKSVCDVSHTRFVTNLFDHWAFHVLAGVVQQIGGGHSNSIVIDFHRLSQRIMMKTLGVEASNTASDREMSSAGRSTASQVKRMPVVELTVYEFYALLAAAVERRAVCRRWR